MAEYKIIRISPEPAREHYNNQYNTTTYYIKVQLEGHPKAVSVGKRTPDALKPGDIIYGTILPTTYDADNFKSEARPNPAAASHQNTNSPSGGDTRDRAFYTSYAKDIAVALANRQAPFDDKEFEKITKAVAVQGDYLFDHAKLNIDITQEVDKVFGPTAGDNINQPNPI